MSKLKNKLLFIFSILVISLIGGIENVYAQTATLTSQIVPGIEFYVKRNGIVYFVGEYTKYDIKDSNSNVCKVAYCIEPGDPETTDPDGYTKINWEKVGLSEEVKQKILLTTYYGYQYPGHQTEEYRAATQALLWEAIKDDEERISGSDATWYVGYTKSYYDSTLDKTIEEEWNLSKEREVIGSLILHHNDKPSFSEESFTAKVGEEIVIVDTNNVLKNYEVYENNGAIVKIEGNELKITPTTSGTIELKFVKKQVYNESYYVYYGKFASGEHAQNMITGGNIDPVYFSIKLTSTINSAAIKVVKIDSNTKDIIKTANIKFKICKADGECIKHTIDEEETDIFYTNDEGIFVTEKIELGKYYLIELDQEMDGYVWNNEPLEFEIGDNIELIKDKTYGMVYQINFENKAVKGSIEISKTGEVVEIGEEGFIYSEKSLEGIEFGLYAKEDIYDNTGKSIYKKDELISKHKTDKNGKLSISDLPLGKYYLKELKTQEDYVLDEKTYDVNLTYKDQYTEKVEYKKTVKNCLKSGELDFTKKEEGTEKAIKGAIINIYTKDDILVFTRKTNENGKININKIPLGQYYLLEKEPPKGYEINDEKIEFEITKHGEVVSLTMYDKKIKIEQVVNVGKTGKNDYKNSLTLMMLLSGISLIIYDKLHKRSYT